MFRHSVGPRVASTLFAAAIAFLLFVALPIQSQPELGPYARAIGSGLGIPVFSLIAGISLRTQASGNRYPKYRHLDQPHGLCGPSAPSSRHQAPVLAPIAEVVDDLSWYIRAHENVVTTRNEYKALRTQLEGLFNDLRTHFFGSSPPAMTTSMLNLCEAIQTSIRIPH
ncbi:hypothetical protein RSAG8_12645, partial [Rhizoctonia solani AG-8 WAC10335]